MDRAGVLRIGLLLTVAVHAPAALAQTLSGPAVSILQERIYRLGPYLTVDGVVGNTSDRPIEGVEVSLELYSFFGELLSVEHTVVRPPSMLPGQKGTYRVVTPSHEEVGRVRYRFTWRADGRQFQSELEPTVSFWR